MFQLEKQSGEARAGRLSTAHGVIETPVFMPVGTRATVKCVSSQDLVNLNAQIILGNAYHLYLQPGAELIERVAGGLHQFMSWERPILTDSGGFQVFSLSESNRRTEEGVLFQDHLSGDRHLITPEKSMHIQRALGSDIVMAFDECPPLPSPKETLRASMHLTVRWAKRCLEVPLKEHQHLFAIIQGGLSLDLRKECLESLLSLSGEKCHFAGFALGGLSVGEKSEEMREFCQKFVPTMPKSMPRYLMGVGTPLDILSAIKSGIDMFDCVLPTRNARNGQFFTRRGTLSIKKQRFREDPTPPDPDCHCRVCQTYSRAYIAHLYRSGEYLAGQLITYHNLHFYLRLLREARRNILEGTFDDFYSNTYKVYTSQEWI